MVNKDTKSTFLHYLHESASRLPFDQGTYGLAFSRKRKQQEQNATPTIMEKGLEAFLTGCFLLSFLGALPDIPF